MLSVLAKGTIAAVVSNFLFAALYLFSEWMKPTTGTTVFAWRMVSTFICLWSWLLLTQRHHVFFADLRRVLKIKRNYFLLPFTSAVLVSQMWMFMWAPVNGYGMDIAVSYFLFPLSMIVAGRFFFGDKLNKMQSLAVTAAAIGVLIQIFYARSFSWVTAWSPIGYPIYFVLRRKMGMPSGSGLMTDITLSLPVALLILFIGGSGIDINISRYWLLVPLLGIFSAAAMQYNLFAAFNLPVPLYSIISYLEPTLLFIIAILWMHTPIKTADAFSYAFIGTGIILMLLNNRMMLKKHSA